jgi:hypothetical protein
MSEDLAERNDGGFVFETDEQGRFVRLVGQVRMEFDGEGRLIVEGERGLKLAIAPVATIEALMDDDGPLEPGVIVGRAGLHVEIMAKPEDQAWLERWVRK